MRGKPNPARFAGTAEGVEPLSIESIITLNRSSGTTVAGSDTTIKNVLTPTDYDRARDALAAMRAMIVDLAASNPAKHFAFNRYIAGRLKSDEHVGDRSKGALKKLAYARQYGLCTHCHQQLPSKGAELHRFSAIAGYLDDNVELIHHDCRIARQRGKDYAA